VELTDLAQTSYTLDSSSPGASALATGDIVDFQVTCVNIIGESEKSDVLTLRVAGVPDAPAAPEETSVVSVGSDIAITVEWAAPAANGGPILGYKLFMVEEQSPA
jgi:hypothetical protein